MHRLVTSQHEDTSSSSSSSEEDSDSEDELGGLTLAQVRAAQRRAAQAARTGGGLADAGWQVWSRSSDTWLPAEVIESTTEDGTNALKVSAE